METRPWRVAVVVSAVACGSGIGGCGDASPSTSDATGPVCSTSAAFTAFAPSSDCSAAALSVSPALCPGATVCPVMVLDQLQCSQSAYGPWVTPFGTDGASVYVVTNVNTFRSRVFTLPRGSPPSAQDIGELSAATNAMRTDALGRRHILAGEMPGLWEVRESIDGWTRVAVAQAPVLPSGNIDAIMGVDARFVDDETAHAVAVRLSDNAALLESRSGSCWTQEVIVDDVFAWPGIDVDSTGQPWVAWFSGSANSILLRLREPNGAQHTLAVFSPWVPNIRDAPRVVTGGVEGASEWPVVAAKRPDGLHVLIPDTTGSSWQDRIVPGSREGSAPGSACPSSSTDLSSEWGIARAANGKIYVAHVEAEKSMDSSLGLELYDDRGCQETASATDGTMDVVFSRLDAVAFTDVLRVRLDSGGAPYPAFEMSVRGNALLVAVGMNSPNGIDLRYFEVDVSGL
jgi:hypothetical protein